MEYIEASDLAQRLLSDSGRSNTVVVDVRDDTAGSMVVGAINAPSESWQDPAYVEQLVSSLNAHDSTKTVVFHCQLSQKRGPAAAAAFQMKLDELHVPEEQRPQV
jgi:rhodanese-related sulfurtransferase